MGNGQVRFHFRGDASIGNKSILRREKSSVTPKNIPPQRENGESFSTRKVNSLSVSGRNRSQPPLSPQSSLQVNLHGEGQRRSVMQKPAHRPLAPVAPKVPLKNPVVLIASSPDKSTPSPVKPPKNNLPKSVTRKLGSISRALANWCIVRESNVAIKYTSQGNAVDFRIVQGKVSFDAFQRFPFKDNKLLTTLVPAAPGGGGNAGRKSYLRVGIPENVDRAKFVNFIKKNLPNCKVSYPGGFSHIDNMNYTYIHIEGFLEALEKDLRKKVPGLKVQSSNGSISISGTSPLGRVVSPVKPPKTTSSPIQREAQDISKVFAKWGMAPPADLLKQDKDGAFVTSQFNIAKRLSQGLGQLPSLRGCKLNLRPASREKNGQGAHTSRLEIHVPRKNSGAAVASLRDMYGSSAIKEIYRRADTNQMDSDRRFVIEGFLEGLEKDLRTKVPGLEVHMSGSDNNLALNINLNELNRQKEMQPIGHKLGLPNGTRMESFETSISKTYCYPLTNFSQQYAKEIRAWVKQKYPQDSDEGAVAYYFRLRSERQKFKALDKLKGAIQNVTVSKSSEVSEKLKPDVTMHVAVGSNFHTKLTEILQGKVTLSENKPLSMSLPNENGTNLGLDGEGSDIAIYPLASSSFVGDSSKPYREVLKKFNLFPRQSQKASSQGIQKKGKEKSPLSKRHEELRGDTIESYEKNTLGKNPTLPSQPIPKSALKKSNSSRRVSPQKVRFVDPDRSDPNKMVKTIPMRSSDPNDEIGQIVMEDTPKRGGGNTTLRPFSLPQRLYPKPNKIFEKIRKREIVLL